MASRVAMAVIVVLIIVLLAFWGGFLSTLVVGTLSLCVVGMGLFVWANGRSNQTSSKSGGGWICDLSDPTKGYGSRCLEVSQGTLGTETKQECETFCLTPDEMRATVANIRRFVTGRGINFPVPDAFLERMATGDLRKPYHDFIRRDIAPRIISLIQQETPLQTQIVTDALGNNLGVLVPAHLYTVEKGDAVYDLMQNFLKLPGVLTPTAEAKYKIWLQKIDLQGSLGVVNPFVGVRVRGPPDPLNKIYVDSDKVDFVAVTRMAETHAYALIVDHRCRRAFLFNPHVGLAGVHDPRVSEAITEVYQPLLDKGFTYADTLGCPIGLQSVTGDYGCRSWSIFGGLLFALNPQEPDYNKLLDYFIGMGPRGGGVLRMFLFYVSEIYKAYTIPETTVQRAIEQLQMRKSRVEVWLMDLWKYYKTEPRPDVKAFLSEVVEAGFKLIAEIERVMTLNPQQFSVEYLRFGNDIDDFLLRQEQLIPYLQSVPPPIQVDMPQLAGGFRASYAHFDLGLYGKQLRGPAREGCLVM